MLDFFGRKDHQVKIRGFRVELAEVDTALASFEAIEHGSAFVVKSDDGDSLAAAVVLKPEMTAKADEIIAYLRERLPVYAVPGAVHFFAELPRGGTGKVDRNALSQQVAGGAYRRKET
jgi:acyl-coenzyme A synthetase/AMP-(fatty) acid ligase